MRYALVLVLAIVAVAAGQQPQVPTYGRGAQSCRSFLDSATPAVAPTSVIGFNAWAQGYVSAMGEHFTLRAADGPETATFLRDYCRARPSDPFRAAVAALVLQLSPSKTLQRR